MDTTIAAVDAVVGGCAQCGRDLGRSPSDAFCSEFCQARWLRARATNPEEVLGEDQESPRGTRQRDVTIGRVEPQQEPVLPPVEQCIHCDAQVRWMPTRRTRIKVNAQPDPRRGNIRWLASERVCSQVRADTAVLMRGQGFPLFVFHGLDCQATRELSSRPRPRQERSDPPAGETTRARVRDQLAAQLGWRPGGSWRWRR